MELVNELPTWQDVERTMTVFKRVRSNLGYAQYNTLISALYDQWKAVWPHVPLPDFPSIIRTLLKDWRPPRGVNYIVEWVHALDHCINKLRDLTVMHESSTYSPGVAGEERLK